MENRQSEVMDWLRFVMAVVVVASHTTFEIRLPIAFFDGVVKIAVPVFFFVSGFLFFSKLNKWDTEIWAGKLRKRLKTLLLPYIIWNVLWMVERYLIDSARTGHFIVFSDFWAKRGGLRFLYDMGFTYIPESHNILGMTILDGYPADFPLWFMRDLMILMIFAPVIWKLIKTCGKYVLFLLFILFFFNIRIPYTGFSMVGMFFFSCGAYFKLNSMDFLPVFRQYRNVSYILACILLTFAMSMHSSYAQNDVLCQMFDYVCRLLACAGLVASFNIADCLLEHNWVKVRKNMANASFFVYAMHILVMNLVVKTIDPIVPDGMLWGWIMVIVRPCLVIGICLATFALMKKWTPKVLAVLTGGRI